MARILCIGEGMVELSGGSGGRKPGYGGDTLNTAIHLARSGHESAFFTALGKEPASRELRRAWQAEGLDCSLVQTHPTREAGLYAITTEKGGERCFSYWRDTSAARAMFALETSAAAGERAAGYELIHFSLISLAILPPEGRDMLLAVIAGARAAGGRIAFDGNYRPVLWAGSDKAAAARDTAIRLADIGLPTWDDEIAVSGPASPEDIAGHWRALGCDEVVVKLGPRGCLLPDGSVLAPPEQLSPLDTSGAGDAFDAGYLAARMRGSDPRAAAASGQALAAWTIMRHGAIPPRDADYPDFAG